MNGRRVKERDFPVILVMVDGQAAPGLPFRQLHWIVTADSTSKKSVTEVLMRPAVEALRLASCGVTPRPIAALLR